MTTALKDASLAGLIRYNGFRFGEEGSTPPTYHLEGTPVYDTAGRSVRFLRYHLEVSTVIHADSEAATSQLMTEVRQRLSQPGKQLELNELGLGEMLLPAGNDAIYGVKPRVVSLDPVGGMLAWQLVWQCEFRVNEQAAGATSQAGDFNVLNYTTTYDIDQHGLTRRVLEGFVQIVQFGSHGERRTADQVRDRLRIAVPSGFHRTQSRWQESADQAQLDFRVIDEELSGGAYPPGMVSAEIDLELGADLSAGQATTARLRVEYRLAPGYGMRHALSRVLLAAQSTSRRLTMAAGGKLVVPLAARLRQRVHRRQVEFQIEYRAMATLADLLSSAGAWEPVEAASEATWRSSLRMLWSNRGHAGLRTDPEESLVLDFSTSHADRAEIGSASGRPTEAEPAGRLPLLVPTITPRQSWLAYRLRVRHVQADSSIETHRLLVEGTATRLKFQPLAPRVKHLGGRQLTEVSRLEEIEEQTTWLGVSMYRLRFALLYEVEGSIDSIEPPNSRELMRGGGHP